MELLEQLNEQQREAVTHIEGPLLILAGAGSGKTRVLTYRTAYLIREMGVDPYRIIAITFTNKAAGEMRERIDQMIGMGAESIWVSTFHSACARILRRYIDRIGYGTNFTIYDTEDQMKVIKEVCKRLEIDTKIHKEKMFLRVISAAKDELIDPVTFEERAAGDYNKRRQAEVYREYQQRLKENNALDFDDMIVKTVELLRTDEQVRNSYQERFRYVMVDEYQDTNTAQFELIRLLAGGHNNLCVVGDDDQSIYRFRGANIHNILNFEKYFPDARSIKLEQNYRSTQNILNAANHVIANNVGRKDKRLWTNNGDGDKVGFEQLETAYEEADYIARDIAGKVRRGEYTYGDCAVLYRTNAQSRLFEERFINSNLPYRIIGGVNFYSRREIKDVLAYLKTIENGQDDVAVGRIINVPKRGIGATTIGRVTDYAMDQEMTFFGALCHAGEIPKIGKAADKLRKFVDLIEDLRDRAEKLSVTELIDAVLRETGYLADLEAEGTDEAQERIANIDELITKAASYDETAEESSLRGFLEEVALVADIDNYDEDTDYVVLMTLHSAKGLEFPNVYLSGMEDGLFPGYLSITSDERDEDGINVELEEERRLAYVGITRAKKQLTLTAARLRMVRGETQYNTVSRFVKEIPSELLRGVVSEPKKKESFEELKSESCFQKARQNFRKTPVYTPVSNQRSFAGANTKGGLDYAVGDRVRHIKFGDGEVTAIVEGGRDYEVTVDFDRAGTKKMFASFAKLKKI